MINLEQSSFYELLPPNLRDQNTKALSVALDNQMKKLAEDISRTLLFANLDLVSEYLLDYLALNFNVIGYDTGYTVEVKRELIKTSFRISSKQGTAQAVQMLMETTFGYGAVEEWFDYGGKPYYFRVTSSNPMATPEDVRKFKASLQVTKNVRSWLEDILILRTWGEVLTRDYLIWDRVLGVKTWGELSQGVWNSNPKETWKSYLGDNTWGNVYSYVWEES